MKVYGFTEKTYGVMEIENTLDAWQQFVGGGIQAVPIAENLMLICNEDGKLINLDRRCVWLQDGIVVDIIFGDCFVCRQEGEEGAAIKDSDVGTIEKIIKPIVIKPKNKRA